METTSNPRASPGDLSEALQASVDRYLRDAEARDRKKARAKPVAPDVLAGRHLRQRLRRLGRKVEEFAARIEAIHSDRSGNNHWGWISPPTNDSDLRSPSPTRPGLLDQWERAEREAAEGCELSRAFVAEFGPMFRLALEVRHQRPPPRAADYNPLEGMTADQRAMVERARRY